jgi:hypothetical protein
VYFLRNITMNTRTKLLALTLSALAVSASFADTREGGDLNSKAFQSTRTRAEVQAEAVQAAKAPTNGQFDTFAVAPVASTLTRAEVRIAAVQANKNHTIHLGESANF